MSISARFLFLRRIVRLSPRDEGCGICGGNSLYFDYMKDGHQNLCPLLSFCLLCHTNVITGFSSAGIENNVFFYLRNNGHYVDSAKMLHLPIRFQVIITTIGTN